MKHVIGVALLLISSTVFASSVVLETVEGHEVKGFNETAKHFDYDFETGEVSASVRFEYTILRCSTSMGDESCSYDTKTLAWFSPKIESLHIDGDKVIYSNSETPIVCANIKESSGIFGRKKIIKMTGKCYLEIVTSTKEKSYDITFNTIP